MMGTCDAGKLSHYQSCKDNLWGAERSEEEAATTGSRGTQPCYIEGMDK